MKLIKAILFALIYWMGFVGVFALDLVFSGRFLEFDWFGAFKATGYYCGLMLMPVLAGFVLINVLFKDPGHGH